MKIETFSDHLKCNNQMRRKQYGVVAKRDELLKPEIDVVDFVFRVVIVDCRDNFFHSFQLSCLCGINFTIMVNCDVFCLTSIFEFVRFKSDVYGLN